MHEIVSFSKEIVFKNMINKITSISLEHTLMLEDKFNIRGDFIVSGSYKMTAASQIENDFSYKIPVDIEVDEKYDLSNLVIDIDDFTYEVIDEEILKVNIDLLLDKLEVKEKKIVVEKLEDDNNLDEIVTANDLFLELDDKKDLAIKGDEDIEVLDVIGAKKDAILEEVRRDDDVQEVNEVFNDTIKEEDMEDIIQEQVQVENNNIQSMEATETAESDASSLFASFDSSRETYSTYSVYIMREGDSVEEVLNKYKVTREMLEEYNDLNNLKIGTKLIIPSVKDE